MPYWSYFKKKREHQERPPCLTGLPPFSSTFQPFFLLEFVDAKRALSVPIVSCCKKNYTFVIKSFVQVYQTYWYNWGFSSWTFFVLTVYWNKTFGICVKLYRRSRINFMEVLGRAREFARTNADSRTHTYINTHKNTLTNIYTHVRAHACTDQPRVKSKTKLNPQWNQTKKKTKKTEELLNFQILFERVAKKTNSKRYQIANDFNR